MFSTLKDFMNPLPNLLMSNLLGIFLNLSKAKQMISTKFLVADFFSVLTSAGMLLLFQLLAFLIFVKLPQGQDVIMVAVDQIHRGEYLRSMGLPLGTLAWSIFSEFAVRYSIYVTDNSADSLSEQRVGWRKAVQQAIADIFLLLPFLVIIFSLMLNYKRLPEGDQDDYFNSFILAAVGTYILMIIVSQIYFSGRNQEKMEEAKPDPSPTSPKNRVNILFAGFKTWCSNIYTRFFPNPDERNWLEKLHGMYNDYVYSIVKPRHFIGTMQGRTKQQAATFLELPEDQRHKFPQSEQHMGEEARAPKEFRLRNFTTDGMDPENPDQAPGKNSGHFRWQYHIPLRFYKRTHRWLAIFVSLSIAWLLIILFLSVRGYEVIGCAGLVLGAFCCWTGIYMGVLFIDYGLLRRGAALVPGSPRTGMAIYGKGWRKGKGLVDWLRRNISLRFILLVWLLVNSGINADHSIRYLNCKAVDCRYDRPEQKEHFRHWANRYIQDSSHLYVDTIDGSRFYPIVMVCAEGGAMRTGAFTTMMLGHLQDELRKQGPDLSESIYACSGVSGGSLGLATYISMMYAGKKHGDQGSLKDQSKKFYSKDHLSAVMGKLLYGDILQLLWPCHIDALDRTIGLEMILEKSYKDVTGENTFSGDFLSVYDTSRNYPAFFINTTEVETGLQCWLSNVKADINMPLSNQRDLFKNKIPRDIRMATAVNFSTRFPIFSPAATVDQSKSQRYHYVDGGYVENTGAATMLEIMRTIEPIRDSFKKAGIELRPYVLMLRFEQEDDSAVANVGFANELSEILLGIYNTRGGRLRLAEDALDKYVADTATIKGEMIKLKLKPNGREIPMSWLFSTNSMNKLDTFVHTLWQQRNVTGSELGKFALIDTGRYKKVHTGK